MYLTKEALSHGSVPRQPQSQGEKRLLHHIERIIREASMPAAAAALANELSAKFAGAQVAVGVVRRRGSLKIVGWSADAQPKAALGTVRAVSAAMDEAVQQQALLRFPPAGDDQPYIRRKHAELARQDLGAALCTVPLPCEQSVYGALTLLRDAASPWSDEELAELSSVAQATGPLLRLKSLAEESAFARLGREVSNIGARLRSPGQWSLKGAAALVFLALAGAAMVPVPVHVTAAAKLEGVMQRSLSAPFDGFIQEVSARAGDMVKQGQVLATLATEDLLNEKRRLMVEVSRYNAESGDAFAREDRGSLVVAQSRAAEAAAQLRLVDQQLARAQITAPFDGVVIRGDLYQHTGAPTRRGDALFVVAPSASYRIVLQIDDEDIARVRQGMVGRLSLSARPNDALAVRLERLTPVAHVEDGRNVFDAHAQLLSDAAGLRPGLQGFAKFPLQEQPLALLVCERLSAWLRFVVWKHLG